MRTEFAFTKNDETKVETKDSVLMASFVDARTEFAFTALILWHANRVRIRNIADSY